jgi:hypothetical protein
MTIGRRILRLARSELNALLDRAARADTLGGVDREGDNAPAGGTSVPDPLADDPLDDALARKFRALEDKLRHESATRARATARPASASTARPRRDDDVRAAYAVLGLKPGADLKAARAAYRALLRRHHPDKHAASPATASTAHAHTQQITAAYRLVRLHLGG